MPPSRIGVYRAALVSVPAGPPPAHGHSGFFRSHRRQILGGPPGPFRSPARQWQSGAAGLSGGLTPDGFRLSTAVPVPPMRPTTALEALGRLGPVTTANRLASALAQPLKGQGPLLHRKCRAARLRHSLGKSLCWHVQDPRRQWATPRRASSFSRTYEAFGGDPRQCKSTCWRALGSGVILLQ
jgi:hypothetical protein